MGKHETLDIISASDLCTGFSKPVTIHKALVFHLWVGKERLIGENPSCVVFTPQKGRNCCFLISSWFWSFFLDIKRKNYIYVKPKTHFFGSAVLTLTHGDLELFR